MINFRFDQFKATQVAAAFLAYEKSRMSYMKLIKLLYLADREALKQRCIPIIGDQYVSMAHGPVVSHVYDLIKGEAVDSEYWDRFIKRDPQDKFVVKLTDDPGTDRLSRREKRIVEELSKQFESYDQWALRDWCHENCPEWQNPEEIKWVSFAKKVVDIQVEEIFQAVGLELSEKDLQAIKQEAELENAAACLVSS